MNEFSRRQFLNHLGTVGMLSAAASLGLPGRVRAQGSGRVVIIGGGFGGATCAKYIRRYGPGTKVTLVEPKTRYVTCPLSNTVLAGLNSMDSITRDYSILHDKYGVGLIRDHATAIDPAGKKVTTQGGQTLAYDHLVVSPGIDFRWDRIEGYNLEVSGKLPHAWQAGSQTRLLRQQLEGMNDGGTVIISTPTGQFRAPPASYERASMIAYYLQENKPNSKVLILDSSDSFTEHDLFVQAWEKLYPGMIEWVNNSQAVKVDAGAMTVTTKAGETHKGDVINIIPPQQAGAIAAAAGLTDESGWCPVNQGGFESTKQKAIHIIGDACSAGEMPKAGSAANTQAKVCAAAIVADLTGGTMPVPYLISVFYLQAGKKYGFSNTGTYRLVDGTIKQVSGGPSSLKAKSKDRRNEVKYADGWYKAITGDTFA